jgi:hypothetical protein
VHEERLELSRLAAPEPKADRGDLGDIEELSDREFAPVGEVTPERLRHAAATSDPPVDAIENALAKAIEGATAAGRFDVVAQLAKELEARRLARAGNVVVLPARRGREGGRS